MPIMESTPPIELLFNNDVANPMIEVIPDKISYYLYVDEDSGWFNDADDATNPGFYAWVIDPFNFNKSEIEAVNAA